jgi:surface antigen
MNMSIKISTLLISLLLITSCASDGRKGISKQGGGAVIGALAGGLLGSQFGKGEGQFLAAGAGALLGAFVGSSIGKSMDDQDKLMAERASQNALERAASGSSTEWKNPDTGHYGFVTPTKTYKTDSGRYCREFTQEVYIGKDKEKAYGTACRQSDGSWQIVNQ